MKFTFEEWKLIQYCLEVVMREYEGHAEKASAILNKLKNTKI